MRGPIVMTMALAVADRAEQNAVPSTSKSSQIYVAADSRLTVDADRSHFLDYYIKTLSLGERSAAVAAGDPIPFSLAVEGTRPFLAVNAADRVKRGLPPMGVFAEASLVYLHLEMLFDQYRELVAEAHVAIIVAGFFSDNTPGLVRIERKADHRQILVFRPPPGGRAYAVVGVESYTPIVKEAIARSRTPEGNGYHDVVSVLWDAIKHQGTPTKTIGGSISFGFCQNSMSAFQWPIIDIEGNTFARGLRYPRVPQWPAPIRIEYNPVLFAALERENAERPFFTGDLPDDAIMIFGDAGLRMGDQRLLSVGGDDLWLLEKLNAREAERAAIAAEQDIRT
jgi:hypothetical protein